MNAVLQPSNASDARPGPELGETSGHVFCQCLRRMSEQAPNGFSWVIQWIGLLGKFLTGNQSDFPMKIMELSGSNFPQQTNPFSHMLVVSTSIMILLLLDVWFLGQFLTM